MKTTLVKERMAKINQRGVALVIILAFLVLLVGLVLAYFSRTVTERTVSNSSAAQTRSDILARGAADLIISDLKQEILTGSASPAPAPSPSPKSGRLFFPSQPAYMVPARNLVAADAVAVPNLIRVSQANDTIASPAVGSRASAVNSYSNPSYTGKSISLARWNSHYLIPRHTTSTTVDSTPISPLNPNSPETAGFRPPDWVFVTKTGPTVIATPDANTIGRYAYAIYDEGGLLDVNVAGFPSNTTQTQSAYKDNLAFADLVTGTGSFLTQPQIDNIVGWRNFATAQPTGTLAGNYIFDATAATRFYNYALSNTNGFLSVNPTPSPFPVTSASRTDQYFTSRQALLKFRRATGFSQNALQYLTTFSRDLNQPSVAPDPTRPPTQTGTGGNDFGTGSLTTGPTSDDAINPSFLTVRVSTTTAGGRNDGSDLIAGEPLVKKRFSLNRLAWLTYKGPSSSNMTDATVQKVITALGGNATDPNDPIYKFVALGTSQNIYNYFGLSWISDPAHSGASEWVYSHSGTAPISSVPTVAASINKLSALTTREPDFFELLRASITLGSLGKAYTAETTSTSGYEQTRVYSTARDQSVDADIFQMGANIIDQFDSDSYPTRILTNTGLQAAPYKEYRGIEDLPYLYRVREAKIRLQDSAPVTYSSLPAANQVLATAGQCVILQEPEIWNPHVWNSTAGDPNIRPTSFRIIALTCNPSHASDSIATGDTNLTANIKLNVQWRSNVDKPSPPATTTPAQPLTSTNSELLFEMPKNYDYLYREPTMLFKPGVPTQSNLRVGVGNTISTLTGTTFLTSFDATSASYFNYPAGVTDDKKYIGFVPGGELLPLSWSGTIKKDAIATGNPTADSPGIIHAEYTTVTSGDSVTYRLQYLDLGSSSAAPRWLTYDEKYAPLLVTSNVDTWSNAGSNQKYQFKGAGIGGYDQLLTAFDPRTRRFGWHMSGRGGRSSITPMSPPSFITWNASDAAQNIIPTDRPDENRGFMFWTPTGMLNLGTNCGSTALGWYPLGPGNPNPMRSGMIAQNNPAAGYASSTARVAGDSGYGSAALVCFADPDGVVRRGTTGLSEPTSTMPATVAAGSAAGAASGQPLKKAYNVVGASTFGATFTIAAINNEAASRPVVLNRPFRSVSELGYTFSDTPWRNLDFFTPESGNAALLDVFCVNDGGDATGMVAGKINLNTRQAPVLQAILAGAYKDELPPSATIPPTAGNSSASAIATGLATRTSDLTASLGAGSGPLRNLSELVGKWVGGAAPISGATSPFNIDGGTNYSGFSGLAATTIAPAQNPPNLSYILNLDASTSQSGYTSKAVQRFREASFRALANTGQTRVWNLMIDLIAQTGRYPSSATAAADLPKFVVEGEQRYWVHVAIDRLTGQVIDKQIEVVKE